MVSLSFLEMIIIDRIINTIVSSVFLFDFLPLAAQSPGSQHCTFIVLVAKLSQAKPQLSFEESFFPILLTGHAAQDTDHRGREYS